MDSRDAKELIAGAVPAGGGTWADMGAGQGAFTRALAERLGPAGTVYAVERDATAISVLRARAKAEKLRVVAVQADFTTADLELPGLGDTRLDGMLFANSLHYVRDTSAMLVRAAAMLQPRGRVVIVEYDQWEATRWVPYPLPPQRFHELAIGAGFSPPTVVATRPSVFGGRLYVAWTEPSKVDATRRSKNG